MRFSKTAARGIAIDCAAMRFPSEPPFGEWRSAPIARPAMATGPRFRYSVDNTKADVQIGATGCGKGRS